MPRRDFQAAPDVAEERAILKDADVFALVYPLWLNAPPAMIKGYLERVFGFGFAYGAGGSSAVPLLQDRKLISFSSSGAPLEWVQQTGALGAVHTLYDRDFADLCGLEALEHVHFGIWCRTRRPILSKDGWRNSKAVRRYFATAQILWLSPLRLPAPDTADIDVDKSDAG